MKKHPYMIGAARGAPRHVKKKWHSRVRPPLDSMLGLAKRAIDACEKAAEAEAKGEFSAQQRATAVDCLKKMEQFRDIAVSAATDIQTYTRVPMGNFRGSIVLHRVLEGSSSKEEIEAHIAGA